MAVRWNPDTCFCILDIDNGVLTKVVQKCELHKNVIDRSLVSEVESMNRFWNQKIPAKPTKEQVEKNTKAKYDEKQTTRRRT